jgi:hypothetical protein
MHRLHSSGYQTYAQLTAEKANLSAARMAKGEGRHTKSERVYRDFHRSTARSRASAGRDRAYNETDLLYTRYAPLGDRWLHYEKRAHVRKPRVTGRNKKFIKEISPGRRLSRTSWGKSHLTSGFHAVIKPRKHRLLHQSHWRRHGHVIIPK